jgi:hypothetical protein
MNQTERAPQPNSDHIVQPKPEVAEDLRGAPMPVVKSVADIGRLQAWCAANPNTAARVHDRPSGETAFLIHKYGR